MSIKIQGLKPKTTGIGLGIDLGTTYTAIACLQNGTIQTLPLQNGNTLLPSVVHYQNDAPVVGQPCLDNIVSVKRLMGRALADLTADELNLYSISTQQNNVLHLQTAAGPKTPIQISADILRAATQGVDKTIKGVVLTVPAHFDDAARNATKDAARLAGLPVIRLVNEPTAAAIAYGLDLQDNCCVAVYDLGGGTFDVSILRYAEGVFDVLSTLGDLNLGGDDMDWAIVHWLEAQAPIPQTRQSLVGLLAQARLAKETLTTQQSANMDVFLEDGSIKTFVLSRSIFNMLISGLVEKTLTLFNQALENAHIRAQDLHHIILVGGATKVPQVVEQLAKTFKGVDQLSSIEPNEVVALGAGRLAERLVGNLQQELLLLDVQPLSIGLEMMGGINEKIILRNTTLPASHTQVYTNYADNQTGITLHVVQGERELAKDCRSLAQFTIAIPRAKRGQAKVEVHFEVDVDGLLTVHARDLVTGNATRVQVQPTYGLTKADLQALLEDGARYAEEDKHNRQLAQATIQQQALIQVVRAAIQEDHQLLSAAYAAEIAQHLHNLEQARTVVQIQAAMESTEAACRSFFDARLQKSLQTALCGQTI